MPRIAITPQLNTRLTRRNCGRCCVGNASPNLRVLCLRTCGAPSARRGRRLGGMCVCVLAWKSFGVRGTIGHCPTLRLPTSVATTSRTWRTRRWWLHMPGAHSRGLVGPQIERAVAHTPTPSHTCTGVHTTTPLRAYNGEPHAHARVARWAAAQRERSEDGLIARR